MKIESKRLISLVLAFLAGIVLCYLVLQSQLQTDGYARVERYYDSASDAELQKMGITKTVTINEDGEEVESLSYATSKYDKVTNEYRYKWTGDIIYKAVGYYYVEHLPSATIDTREYYMQPYYSIGDVSDIDISPDKKTVIFTHFDSTGVEYTLGEANGEKLVEFFRSPKTSKYYDFS